MAKKSEKRQSLVNLGTVISIVTLAGFVFAGGQEYREHSEEHRKDRKDRKVTKGLVTELETLNKNLGSFIDEQRKHSAAEQAADTNGEPENE